MELVDGARSVLSSPDVRDRRSRNALRTSVTVPLTTGRPGSTSSAMFRLASARRPSIARAAELLTIVMRPPSGVNQRWLMVPAISDSPPFR